MMSWPNLCICFNLLLNVFSTKESAMAKNLSQKKKNIPKHDDAQKSKEEQKVEKKNLAPKSK
jgi:hypothetical protein